MKRRRGDENETEAGARGARMAIAKVKTTVSLLFRFISRGRALRSARPARINCRGIFSR
jgi:hypothetical protein